MRELKVCVGELVFLGQNFPERHNGRFEVALVHVALRFVQQIVQRIGELLRLAWRRFLCLILLRSAAARGPMRRYPQDKCEAGAGAGASHGSADEAFVPFTIVSEGPKDFDAPFAERFAWPFACSPRERYRPVADSGFRATCSCVPAPLI